MKTKDLVGGGLVGTGLIILVLTFVVNSFANLVTNPYTVGIMRDFFRSAIVPLYLIGIVLVVVGFAIIWFTRDNSQDPYYP